MRIRNFNKTKSHMDVVTDLALRGDGPPAASMGQDDGPKKVTGDLVEVLEGHEAVPIDRILDKYASQAGSSPSALLDKLWDVAQSDDAIRVMQSNPLGADNVIRMLAAHGLALSGFWYAFNAYQDTIADIHGLDSMQSFEQVVAAFPEEFSFNGTVDSLYMEVAQFIASRFSPSDPMFRAIPESLRKNLNLFMSLYVDWEPGSLSGLGAAGGPYGWAVVGLIVLAGLVATAIVFMSISKTLSFSNVAGRLKEDTKKTIEDADKVLEGLASLRKEVLESNMPEEQKRRLVGTIDDATARTREIQNRARRAMGIVDYLTGLLGGWVNTTLIVGTVGLGSYALYRHLKKNGDGTIGTPLGDYGK